jgi:hypothetical protein
VNGKSNNKSGAERTASSSRPDADFALRESGTLRSVLRAYLTLYVIFAAIALLIGILSSPA